MNKFNELIDNQEILDFIKESGFKDPTEVQSKTIKLFFAKENLSVLAQTGTGKTLAYALPLVEMLKLSESENPDYIGPRAVVIAPTRELAKQIVKVFKSIAHHAKFRVRELDTAGRDRAQKMENINKGKIDVLVSGPGKLAKALKAKEISLDECHHVIMDEADQLLDLGFKKDISFIANSLRNKPQVCLYSATMPLQLDEFRDDIFKNMTFSNISLQGTHTVKQSIETFNIFVSEKDKEEMAQTFLKEEAKGQGIIFLNKKGNAVTLFDAMVLKFPAKKFYLLHGDMGVKERRIAYREFSSGKGGVLISTDIAARGIDIDGLKWVLNYDLPFEAVYYIHRSGRVGRSGNTGTVYNLVTGRDSQIIKRINSAIKNQSSLKITEIPSGTNQKGATIKGATGGKKAIKKVAKKKIKRSPGFKRRKK